MLFNFLCSMAHYSKDRHLLKNLNKLVSTLFNAHQCFLDFEIHSWLAFWILRILSYNLYQCLWTWFIWLFLLSSSLLFRSNLIWHFLWPFIQCPLPFLFTCHRILNYWGIDFTSFLDYSLSCQIPEPCCLKYLAHNAMPHHIIHITLKEYSLNECIIFWHY